MGTHSSEPAGLEGIDHSGVVARIAAVAGGGADDLRALWDELVSTYGEEAASRLWQEGLAASDIGQT